MMKVKMKNFLVIFVSFILFSTSSFLSSQKKENLKQEQSRRIEEKWLREDILTAYKLGGELRLRNLLKKEKDKISKEFIRDFVNAGRFMRKEEFIEICEIIAKEKNDEEMIAYVFSERGESFRLISDYINAVNYFDQAFSLYLKLNDSLGLGKIYMSKGIIYVAVGDVLRAIEMYNKALPLFVKAKHLTGLSDLYCNMGDIYADIQDKVKAFEMYDKALTFSEIAEDPFAKSRVYLRKGYLYINYGDDTKALEMCYKALPIFEEVGDPIWIGYVYYLKANIPGINSRALEMYDKAIIYFERSEEPLSLGRALHDKAKVLDKLGKKDEALNLFEKGIANLEKFRTQTALSKMKKIFMENYYGDYQKTVLFMLGNKYYNKGFKYAEAMRARMFLDQMGEGLTPLKKGLTSELKEEKDLLVGKLSALSRQMQETPGNEDKNLHELKEEYRKVESQFDDLLIKIRLENPLYASVNYPQPISVQDLQKEILKEGETMLSYFISQDESYAFVISKNNFNVEPLKIKENEVNSSVERYLLAIKGNNTNDTNRYGSLLYEKLFKPLEKYLEKSSDIIIVPAGQLEKIPFESFIIDNKKPGPPVYLLEKYRLKYVQSATLLSILRKHYTQDTTAKGFIGFGDPVYDYENFKQNKPEQGSFFSREGTRRDAKENPLSAVGVNNNPEGNNSVSTSQPLNFSPSIFSGDEIKEIHRDRFARAGGVMDRLPQSGEEIQSIAQLFEKESLATKVYLRDQAAEENARAANMKDFAYIHFSCHGLLNDDFQCLVLSQLPGSKEDGYFTLNEIMNCDYNAKLIVLSACQTGSGKMARGEGITGLTRAFMYAGSPAVAASLWDVDDAATKELMVKFYSNILEKNLDKVEALRQAKLELLKNEKYSSPLFWSAFVMYGE